MPFTFSLAPPLGPYSVGARTFTRRVQPSIQVGQAKLAATNEPALLLNEVAFTAYYPAAVSADAPKGLDWLIKPTRVSHEGFARFSGLPLWLLWPVLYIFGKFIKIPAYVNAPLLSPPGKKQWPLVIFSHGLCGTRNAYSQLCSTIAASGRVVLAVEHRDGTAPACVTSSGNIFYYRESDIIFPNSNKDEATSQSPPFALRTEQLEFRRHEIYRIYQAFRALVCDNTPLASIDGGTLDSSWFSTSDHSLVDCDTISLAGHSFGGCTVLSILSTPPPTPSTPPLPLSHVLLYDPWLEPLPTPGPTPCRPPEKMLVMNSQVFTLWKDHFSRLVDVVSAWAPQGRNILTFVGSQHAAFSDFAVLPFLRRKSGLLLINRISTLSLAFLEDSLDEELQKTPQRSMQTRVIGKFKDGRPKRALIGDTGDVVIH